MKRGNVVQKSSLPYFFRALVGPRSFERITPLRRLVCSVFASLGIFGGISALFVGLVCVVIHTLITSDTIFDRAGTVFLIVAIPAILIGSMFIDENEQGSRYRC